MWPRGSPNAARQYGHRAWITKTSTPVIPNSKHSPSPATRTRRVGILQGPHLGTKKHAAARPKSAANPKRPISATGMPAISAYGLAKTLSQEIVSVKVQRPFLGLSAMAAWSESK